MVTFLIRRRHDTRLLAIFLDNPVAECLHFWILLELRMMEVVDTTGAIGRAKFQSNRHHQQTNTQLFRWDVFPVVQPTASEH